VHEVDGVVFAPFVAYFSPFASPAWLEPVQPFVLYWRSWPRRDADGNIAWCEEGDDSLPEEIARWRLLRFTDAETFGLLEIRRDRLMTFLAEFEYDLAIYFEENIEANELDDGWRDEGLEASRYWRVWATDVHLGIRAMLRAVTYLERPAREEHDLRSDARERVPFVVGSDAQGRPITATHPPAQFLTPVFFKTDVLERYYADPSTYRVEAGLVHGGRQWSLSIAHTDRNTIQAWLGDLNGLPTSVQRYWAEFSIPDRGVPQWRLHRDLLGQFVDARAPAPVVDLMRAIDSANAAAEAVVGEPLYAPVEEVHADAIRTMRVPANPSFAAFNEQVRTLALLVVDHLSARFLDAAEAPRDRDGTLARLARLVEARSGDSLDEAKERIGGLYAVQAVRSKVASHRTGPEVDETLARAGISRLNLPAGFVRLVEGATASINGLSELVKNDSSCC
jgi:hypothetical protein